MRSRRVTATLVTAIALAWLTTAPTARTSEEYYCGIEIGGRLCGHARIITAPVRHDGRELILLTREAVIRATLLGGPVDVGRLGVDRPPLRVCNDARGELERTWRSS
ncbi:MAG: hypothetical protein AB1806_17710 [Acidobacteriota bacterium]